MERMFLVKLLCLAFTLSVVFGEVTPPASRIKTSRPLFNNMSHAVVSRGVDGGEGEYTPACLLSGYYEFFSESSVDYSSCGSLIPSSIQLVVHFYEQTGVCYADVALTSFREGWCYNALNSQPVVGNLFQEFYYVIESLTPIIVYLDVVAFSQSRPVVYVTNMDCCLDASPLVGSPVEDVNTVGLANCYTEPYTWCSPAP